MPNAELTTMLQYLEQRLEQLESRQAFQDDTIEELNQIIIKQQLDVSRMTEKMRLLGEKLKATNSSIIAPMSEETPPPHY